MRTLPAAGTLSGLVLFASISALARPVPGLEPQAAGQARSQGAGVSATATPATVEAIDAEFQRAIRELEVRRLDRIAKLAADQEGVEADQTYETYFRRAIDAELFAEAEPVAERVIEAGKVAPVVSWLAHIVNIFAEAERGAFRESLDSLIATIQAADADDAGAANQGNSLPLEARLRLEEAYFQRLVRSDQYAIAKEAFTLLRDGVQDPVVREFTANRLKQLELIGQPAPPIAGQDVDGQPAGLADLQGNVVLVVFWASWCLPNAEQAERLDAILRTYRDQGFRVLGVNVDALDENLESIASVLPNIRRFMLDYNITWPSVLDTPAEGSIAEAYGVIDLPTSILIGRDGTVRGLVITGSDLERKVAEALQQPKP